MKWIIEGTDHEEEATETGYRRLSMMKAKDKSLAGKKIVLVDDGGLIRDDINTLAAARKAGLLEKEAPMGKPVLTSDGMIDYTLTLPPEAFAMFNMAKSFGFIKDGEMSFDQWVCECIDRRFTTDYNVEIVLQPVGGRKKEDTRETVKEAVKEALAEGAEGSE